MKNRIYDSEMFSQTRYPYAVLRVCALCKFSDSYRTGGGGRGNGFRVGNKSRGLMIQHFKAAHPAEYAALKATVTHRLNGEAV